MLKPAPQRFFLIAGCILIFSLGTLFAFFTRSKAHQALRTQLLYTVDLAVSATDPDLIERLPVTSEDIFNPEYIRLHQQYLQLQAPLQQKDIRWIYAMKVFGEEVRFVVDSVDINDPGHSEPGVVYEQPPVSVFNVMHTGKTEFIGPFTDEYGSYYSAFAPIWSTDGRIIAVMGADIEQERYETIIRQRSMLPIIVTLFVELLFIICFLYVVRHWEIERMKSQFVSIASHQLKTPITALNWMVEVLAEDKAVKARVGLRAKVKDLEEIVQNMRELVSSLLNVSRVEAGRVAVCTQVSDVGSLAAAKVKEVTQLAKKKGQAVSLQVQPNVPSISIDAALVGEIYKNLLTNAIKYTPKGGKIEVRIVRKNSEILSSVTDTGYGIPKNEQGRVFQKFYRGSNITQLEHDGTGLGLYLVKEIVKISGGRIWFTSTEGRGTTFFFTLPIAGSKPKEGEMSIT